MSSGELRHKIVIQSQSALPLTAGDFEKSKVWSNIDSSPNYVWGNVQYSAGSESSDDRDSTTQRATIKIRYRTDITNKMRVTFDGRIFDIESHQDLMGKRKYLHLSTVISNGV